MRRAQAHELVQDHRMHLKLMLEIFSFRRYGFSGKVAEMSPEGVQNFV